MHLNDHLPPAHRHFDHHRLDAWHIAKQALIEGMAILNSVPRGYGKLKDQGQGALCSSFTLTSEGAARTGADRSCRMRWARAESTKVHEHGRSFALAARSEAAAVFEALGDLKLVEQARMDAQLDRLWRLSAILTGLARVR